MFQTIMDKVCRSSLRHPVLWLVAAAVLSVPAAIEIQQHLTLNTDLRRLLPTDSPSAKWSRELQSSVGDGGVFTILFAGKDHAALRSALEAAAARVQALPEVRSVDYKYPVDFVRRFGYLLVPSDALRKLFDTLVVWKAKASPLGLKLDEQARDPAYPKENGTDEVRAALQLFSNLPEIHQSEDGQTVGMLISGKRNTMRLGETKQLLSKLETIAHEEAKARGIWGEVGGSMRNKVDVYNLVLSDLSISGMVAGLGILIVLALSFRSILMIPVLMLPLGIGLVWSFAMIPIVIGDLNTITSFLMMILLGMGVEFSIHLVKRFQSELEHSSVETALVETFRSTGRAIVTSGLTTSSGMFVLCVSSLRGFSEYGIISGTSMLTVVAVVLLFLPATIVLGVRLGIVKPKAEVTKGWSLLPSPAVSIAICALVIAAGLYAARSLRFDYDFSELQTEDPSSAQIKAEQRKVYPGSLTPGALYVAQDLNALDGAIDALEKVKSTDKDSPTLGRLASLREFGPMGKEAAARRRLLGDLHEALLGRWIRHVEDPTQKRAIESVRDFVPPPKDPTLSDIPDDLRRSVEARDGSGKLIIGVYPSVERKNGKNSMAFADDLRRVQMPKGVQGPTGEMMIFAEILELVTKEGPRLVALTVLAIFLLVLWDSAWSLSQTLWILMPLVGGVILTVGGMAALGWKLNFFNMVVLPNLIGMSVDSGVHYYHRWLELKRDTREVQQELFSPLTVSMLTTVIGYAALGLAHHQGLRSIGLTAVLGLVCCWATPLFLLPGLLRLRERSSHGHPKPILAEAAVLEAAFGEPQIG
jgi:hypothetical protein